MQGFLNLRRSFLEAVVVGLLVTSALFLPPLQLGTRANFALYDLWSRLDTKVPATDILLVRLDDPALLAPLADSAAAQHAKLLVTTLPDPPTPSAAARMLGPVDLPIGTTRLRRTDWPRGGHLLFEPDLDGVVRRDQPLIDDAVVTPSLALFAAKHADAASAESWDDHWAPEPFETNVSRWIRFFAGHPFREIAASELLRDPAQLRDKIAIAGRSSAEHVTPVGPLTTREMVAQALAGYRTHQQIDAGALGSIMAWTVALALLALLAIRPFHTRFATAGFVVGATAAFVAWSAVSFWLAALWLPVVGPATVLFLTGSVLVLRDREVEATRAGDDTLVNARRATASGNLEEAWLLYRQLPPGTALLAELYELAASLQESGLARQAADLFHRVAQVDAQYKDVAKRLVACGQQAQTPEPPPEELSLPTTLGRYQLLEPIGRGAMGYVYLGRDPKINRIVAVKAINLALEFDAAELESASDRFLREAETAGRLSHPNIVTIYDVGEADGYAYIAMEYLKGRHLSEFATPGRLLPISTVLDLFARTADALDYAHAQNVVHRDIKPANIMYDSISDGLKITDFGIARLIDVSRTRTGIVLGTPAFMSPEQLEGKNVNGHTDLFALGVSLYQLLTGHLPFRGASMTKLMFVIANEPHESVTSVRGDLPGCLDPIIDRALAKDPVDRFQTGAEMAAALRHAAAQLA